MKIRRILLTGDDGYNSIGTRLLVRFLKNKYDLAIVGTKTQQSGVGGRLTLRGKIKWEEIEVDGVRGVCVHGSPCDGMEFGQGYFKKHFDLVISGINMGPNIGATLVSSGTYSAAVRALAVGLAKRAIVMSWYAPIEKILMDHHINHDIKPYLEHPGSAAELVFRKIMENDFWRCKMVNVNFPKKKTNKIKTTGLLSDATKFIRYPVIIDRKNKTFAYPYFFVTKKVSAKLDMGAINRGLISITPMKGNALFSD